MVRLNLFRSRLRFALAAAVLAMAVSTLPGCVLFSFLSQAFDPPVEPVYKLAEDNTRTLIIVDDPTSQLVDPSLPGRMATRIGFQLKENGLKIDVVPQDKLADFAIKKGDDYIHVPADTVGKEMGAKQVIHVHVERVEMNEESGIFRPLILARLKVIDVDQHKRVFPALDKGAEDLKADAARGFPVQTTLFYKSINEGSRADLSAAGFQLADKSANEIAMLFYEHEERPIGEKMKD